MTSNALVKLEVEIKMGTGNYAPAESVAKEKIQQQLLYGFSGTVALAENALLY